MDKNLTNKILDICRNDPERKRVDELYELVEPYIKTNEALDMVQSLHEVRRQTKVDNDEDTLTETLRKYPDLSDIIVKIMTKVIKMQPSIPIVDRNETIPKLDIKEVPEIHGKIIVSTEYSKDSGWLVLFFTDGTRINFVADTDECGEPNLNIEK